MRKLGAVVGCVLAMGCTTTTETFECRMGQLTGVWRIHYAEVNGDCGAIQDEQVALGSEATAKDAAKCVMHTNVIAPDKCSVEQDFTCPTSDKAGESRMIGKMRQTGEGSASGTYTLRVDHKTLGTCRSTYDVTWTKL